MTNGIASTIEDWTGARPLTCPWRAFFDPFVVRVLRAVNSVKDGDMSWYDPEPTNRFVEGVSYYRARLASVQAKRLREDREKAERERQRGGHG